MGILDAKQVNRGKPLPRMTPAERHIWDELQLIRAGIAGLAVMIRENSAAIGDLQRLNSVAVQGRR